MNHQIQESHDLPKLFQNEYKIQRQNQEISLAFIKLVSIFHSQTKVNKIITLLYQRMQIASQPFKQLEFQEYPVHNQSEQGQEQTGSFGSAFESQADQTAQTLGWEAGILQYPTEPIHILKREKIIPRFQNLIDEEFYEQKKLAALSFIHRGYGNPFLRQQIKKRGLSFDLSDNRYKSVCIRFSIEAFQKLEDFLEDKCEMKISRCNYKERANLFAILVNCRKLFESQEVHTFLKFIALIYDESEKAIEVTPSEANRFYKKARELLKEKMHKCEVPVIDMSQSRVVTNRKQLLFTQRVNKNAEKQLIEQKLVDLFVRHKRIRVVRERLQEIYGPKGELKTCRTIEQRIYKLIRRGLKRIQELYQQNHGSVPDLANFKDPEIKGILSNPEALELRIKLLLFSRKKGQQERESLSKMIESINEFVRLKEQLKKKGDTALERRKRKLIQEKKKYLGLYDQPQLLDSDQIAEIDFE